MRYHALACDYDGTLARHGRVDDETLASLERLRRSGRKLIMVTGRQLGELLEVFPQAAAFDRIVAENGALVYNPESREEQTLAEAAPPNLISTLKDRGVNPLAVGRVIVATWEPHQAVALEVIRDLGLELQVIFNKGAVMILPSGINKAAGLRCALSELRLSPHNAVAIGDAENDHAFFSMCECSVAVANALPQLKERADLVTEASHGAGVAELIDRIIVSDLSELEPRLTRHHILVGTTGQSEEITLASHRRVVLISGMSGSGKSTLATSLLERMGEREYQFCIIDPEGDYEHFEGLTSIGDEKRTPSIREVLDLLASPGNNVSVNLLGIELSERPAFFQSLFARIQELRSETGRPHWMVLDEAHHLLPPTWDPNSVSLAKDQALLLITVHPDTVSSAVLSEVDTVLSTGESPEKAMQSLRRALGQDVPDVQPVQLGPGEALLWSRDAPQPETIRTVAPKAERRRHQRKYAEGELGEDRSFYFRGADQKLNLRAHNLAMFVQLANGVDDETWEYHRQRGDYSVWFRVSVKDEDLASEAAAVEQRTDLSPVDSRKAIESAIRVRYTASASNPSR